MAKKQEARSKLETTTESALVYNALCGQLIFRPVPPGDLQKENVSGLKLPRHKVEVDVTKQKLDMVLKILQAGVLTAAEVQHVAKIAALPAALRKKLLNATGKAKRSGLTGLLDEIHELDHLAVLAIEVIDRAQESLLNLEPLIEFSFHFTDTARAILAVGWEAMTKRGIFPLPPLGSQRIGGLYKNPCGAMHFVSASDLDAGYNYTMGIALSPEAQSLGKMDVSYGLDGELIVPGQAVSPIPPFLAMATRLFAAEIPTSSNISEEVQSIPMRNYPHPSSYNDLEPKRAGIYRPPVRLSTIEQLIGDLRQQLWRNTRSVSQSTTHKNTQFVNHSVGDPALPPVKAVFEVTGMAPIEIRHWIREIVKEKDLARQRKGIAFYLNIETTSFDRVSRINEVVDVAAEFGLRYVAVADDEEDQWLPNLLEYLEPYELNAIADYSNRAGVVVIDGRPVDPIYTAATSAQRIQSVYTTLAVDILKMGLWLCLDALAARTVYRELLNNPHIPKRMLLMPIGIIEPWNAFVDNRNLTRTPRAILDPFEKIKFMIEEAKALNMPSLLTDTRHKETWVLLGRKTSADEPHPREEFLIDPVTKAIISRKEKSAIPLLTWKEFMECERLARRAGVLLGQAGSVETPQLFRIISETTYDAAKDRKNPATAIWTAETERVLSTQGTQGSDLQTQRSAVVSPFLAVINRGFESHAKLDGWLRYLEDLGQGNRSLRESLQRQRELVNQQLKYVIEAQARWRFSSTTVSQRDYQKAWDQFRSTYLNYHSLIRDNFVRIRDLVAKAWARKSGGIRKKSTRRRYHSR